MGRGATPDVFGLSKGCFKRKMKKERPLLPQNSAQSTFLGKLQKFKPSPKLRHGTTSIWQNISHAWNPKSSQRNAGPERDGSEGDKVLNFCYISSNKIKFELGGKGMKRPMCNCWVKFVFHLLERDILEFIKTSCCHRHTSMVLEHGCDLSHEIWKRNKTKLLISFIINSFNR